MTGFSKIPPEILVHIWRHIECTDIDSFALVSHDVRALGAKQLKEHEDLNKKYSIVWSEPQRNGSGYFETLRRSKESKIRYLINTLNDVVGKPRLGYYVKQLCIGCLGISYFERLTYTEEEQTLREEQTSNSVEVLQSLVQSTACITGTKNESKAPRSKIARLKLDRH